MSLELVAYYPNAKVFIHLEVQSLHQLFQFIRRFVALNLPDLVWVQAEIAQVNERRGHYYLSLVEKDTGSDAILAQGQANFWSNSAKRWERDNRTKLSELLQVGRNIKLLVKVSFHEQYGLSLAIADIDQSYTLGLLAQERAKTIDYLHSNGLWDCNRRLSLPTVPQRLAIISSPNAAGLEDFMQQLTVNEYGYRFQTKLFAAAMQGTQTSTEILRQLRTINRQADYYDALVVVRGGGSRLDLQAFDEQELCAGLVQARLPIVTGIGHEVDTSVLDMVAHTSVKTPTAAAEFLVQQCRLFEEGLVRLQVQLQEHQVQYLQLRRERLPYMAQQLQQSIKQWLDQHKWQLTQAERELPLFAQQQVQKAWLQQRTYEDRLRQLSPQSILERGFSLVQKGDKTVTSKSSIKQGDRIEIHFQDGTQTLKVDECE